MKLTSPEKLFWPEADITKADLAAYYETVGRRMLPFVRRRLLSLVRCPDGREHCFFQRHASQNMPDAFRTLPVDEKEGDREDYLYIDDAEGLAAAAQIGALELHIWGSEVDDIEKPTRLVLDFDPDPSVGFPAVKAAAAEMREALDAVGLTSFPLLTGGKGIHVVAPIAAEHPWPVVKAAARALAESFAERAPDRFVAVMSKEKRKGKIFIDHFRNERSASAIAPYSPRAREGAPLAWPVAWETLDRFDAANAVRLTNFNDHLGEEPWPEWPKRRQRLTKKALAMLGMAED